ncbi:hypothetical protein HPG69_000745 [Diceros bicornis minor]|uniref:Uncharacterized protein n=1 Tax=Diceros bicornis minor TaxID=77932 RepID=A0A7J7FIH4_DICBM|nr:hypothetical protein HPG69_000745 [Diceros bicornis minor]
MPHIKLSRGCGCPETSDYGDLKKSQKNVGNLKGSGDHEKLVYQITEDIELRYLTQKQFALNRNQQKL